MKRIASFEIDHDALVEGIYISRIDGDAVTYDLRLKRPNNNDFLSTGAIHTIEHLLATYVRNSSMADKIIYAGPMGCRTGLYLVVRNPNNDDVIKLIISAFRFIADFDGDIPGATAKECGNYLDHDLISAKHEAQKYYEKIEHWNEKMLKYPKHNA